MELVRAIFKSTTDKGEIRESLAKGFKPVLGEIEELLSSIPPVKNSSVISTLCIGRHVGKKVLKDFCNWATACIQYGVNSEKFAEVWLELMDGESNEFMESLGRYLGETDRLESEFWEDNIQGNFDELYAKAVKKDGDRFSWRKDKLGYYHLVALRGDFDLKKVRVSSEDYRLAEIGKGPGDFSREFEAMSRQAIAP